MGRQRRSAKTQARLEARASYFDRVYAADGLYVGAPERQQRAIAAADARMPEPLRAVLSGTPASAASPAPTSRPAISMWRA